MGSLINLISLSFLCRRSDRIQLVNNFEAVDELHTYIAQRTLPVINL